MSVNEPKSHTMSAKRTCGACGGTGEGPTWHAPIVDGAGRYLRPPCPVCAGSGHVDAKASRADKSPLFGRFTIQDLTPEEFEAVKAKLDLRASWVRLQTRKVVVNAK